MDKDKIVEFQIEAPNDEVHKDSANLRPGEEVRTYGSGEDAARYIVVKKGETKDWRYNIAMVAIAALALMTLGDVFGYFFVGLVMDIFPNMSDGIYYAIDNYLIFIGIFMIFPLYLFATDKAHFSEILKSPKGLKGNTIKMFIFGILLGAGTNAACILMAWLNGDVHFVSGYVDWAAMLVAMIVVFIQSSAEELMMRHYVLGALRRRYPVWLAIIFNSVFFMALHLANPGINFIAILDLLIIGISYSIAVVYLDSLWLPIAMHTAWNFTQNFIFGLPNSGLVSESSILKLDAATATSSFFYDVGFGVEATIPATVIDLLVGVLIILYAKRKRACTLQELLK